MIELLRELATLLARDPLTVDDVVERLGPVVQDTDYNLLIDPRNPLLGGVNLVRLMDQHTLEPGETPAFLELTPAEPLALGSLEQMFGVSKTIWPDHEEELPQAIFEQPVATSLSHETVLIAAVDDGRVLSLTLRRDPSL